MKKFKQKYGFWATFALTLAGAIGASLLISYNVVTFLAGFDPIFLVLAWILGGLAILPENLILVEPAINYQENGTTYAWIKRAGWKVVGFWFGWVLVAVVSAAAIAGTCIALGQLSSFLIDAGAGTNLLAQPWAGKGIALGILAILICGQIFIKNSGKYSQYFFWALTILPIFFILVTAMIYGNIGATMSVESKFTLNKSLGTIFMSGGMLIPAITYTSYAYSGVEFPTYITEEIEKPEKTVPKAVIFSLIALIVIYLIFGLAIMSLTPIDQLGNPNGGSPDSMLIPSNLDRLPQWAKITFQVMALFLFIGSINTFLVTYSWLVYKLAEERDLFKIFKKTNKNGVPWLAMLFIVGLGVMYVLVDDLYKIIAYFTLSVSLLKITMVTTTIYLRRTDKNYKILFKNKLFYTLVVLAYITCALTFGGGVAAIFFFQPEASKAIENLIFDIIFMLALVALIPIGMVKFYFQDYKKKQRIRTELGLKTNKQLRYENLNNVENYTHIKKVQDKLIEEKIAQELLIQDQKK